MAKSRPSGAGFVGFADPNVTKIEWYRGYTTKNPLQLDNRRVSRSLLKGESVSEVREHLISAFQKSAKGRAFLSAHTIPKIVFDEKSLQHQFSAKNMSRQKLSVLTDFDRLNYLLSKGTVLEERVHITSTSGQIKGYKKDWEHVWKIRGRVFIGNKDHRFVFTIAKSKKEDFARIYDAKIYEKKK